MTMRDASEVIAARIAEVLWAESKLVTAEVDRLAGLIAVRLEALPAATPPAGAVIDPHAPSLPGQPVKMVKVYDATHGTVMAPAAADYYATPPPAAADVVALLRDIRATLTCGDAYHPFSVLRSRIDAAIKGDSHA